MNILRPIWVLMITAGLISGACGRNEPTENDETVVDSAQPVDDATITTKVKAKVKSAAKAKVTPKATPQAKKRVTASQRTKS